jgi:hypothetical protein
MDNTKQITGKVAAIIDDTTLVLSVGSDRGVFEGQLFAIVSTHDQVFDPDTGESLGEWESVKGRVIVTHVQQRMATAQSPLVEESGDSRGTLSEMMVRHSFGLYGEREKRTSLDVRTGSAAGRPRTPPIEIGDMARSISLEAVVKSAQTQSTETVPDLPSKTYASSPAASDDLVKDDSGSDGSGSDGFGHDDSGHDGSGLDGSGDVASASA